MSPAESAGSRRSRPPRRREAVGILVYNLDAAGGMERQAGLLARELSRQGRRVVVVSSFFPRRGIGLGPGDPPLHERREGVVIYRVPTFSNLLWKYVASQNLYETVAAWVLHKHAVGTIYSVQAQTGGVHAARLGPLLGRPALVKLACSGSVGDIAKAHETPQGARVHGYLRALDRVVYLNEESRDEALAIGVAPARLAFVPNGIDLARFPREAPRPDSVRAEDPGLLPELGPELAAGGGRELVLFVGRLDRQKRVSVLLEAFARVVARRPRARLAVAGAGPDRAALEDEARARGLAGKAVFLGVRDDVPALLRAARVFALPSAEEGQSNALLEAMAAGTPAVATDIPGNRTLVRDGEEALLVPVDDAAALEGAILRLLEDPALAERLASAARRRVEETYAIESVARRYQELFDSLPRGPRLSSARFLARYSFSHLWGVSGVLGHVLWTTALTAVSIAVVALKRVLGIEGTILRR